MRCARRISAAGLVLPMTLTLFGCVEERVTPSRGVRMTAPAGAQNRSSVSSQAALPGGPVATPAVDARNLISRVVVSLQPRGVVPFDGQVLPIISPDGRYLATQTGDAPTWPTLLAQAGASPPLRTSVELYDITGERPRPIDLASDLPPGLLLGMDADERGVLVESPRPDGSRWIGRLTWAGALQWIVQDETVDAHAAIWGPDRIVFSRRELRNEQSVLVMRHRDQEFVLSEPGVSTIFPIAGDDRTLFYFELSSTGLELVARQVDRADAPRAAGAAPVDPRRPFGNVIARRQIAADPDPFLAYQSVAARPSTPADLSPSFLERDLPLLLVYHPVLGRMVVFDGSSSEVLPLHDHTIAGAWMTSQEQLGVFLTSEEGLVHQQVSHSGRALEASPAARALAGSFVPFETDHPEMPWLLLGPGGQATPNRLALMGLRLASESE